MSKFKDSVEGQLSRIFETIVDVDTFDQRIMILEGRIIELENQIDEQHQALINHRDGIDGIAKGLIVRDESVDQHFKAIHQELGVEQVAIPATEEGFKLVKVKKSCDQEEGVVKCSFGVDTPYKGI